MGSSAGPRRTAGEWNNTCTKTNLSDTLGDLQMATSEFVKNVSDTDFEQTISAGKPVFVDFWAPWCGPCRIIGPIVEELAPSYDGRVVITKMNVDDNPNVAQRFGVTSIPTLMMFKDGKLVDRQIGLLPKGELQKFIDRNI
jgi:thioredoxin 1